MNRSLTTSFLARGDESMNNDRIRKIYQEARQIAIMRPDFMEEWEYKFAELIIDECIDVVIESDNNPKMIVHEPYRTIMENIKEHFGVEK